jgi:hypothetical protein
MAKVLTTASRVLCGPDTGTHGGRVSTASSARLRVNGNPVLLRSGVGPAVPDCKTPSSSSTKPCTSVLTVVGGEAGKLRVGGNPVMLDTIGGTTDGVPPGTVPASAEQDKLTAI